MTNRLDSALSPYLRAHAQNPVDWFPWGEEAFAKARRLGVPLLISIGYSTCHWCHVMARESFEDPETAALINADFVAIKVDREEHPEVDGAYLAAASAFTENLGWPLTVFATPEGRAFYAGTYWPPAARGGFPAFRDVLASVRDAWRERRDQAVSSADAVTAALRAAAASSAKTALSEHTLLAAAERIADHEDQEFGGFGNGAKFPVATVLGFLSSPLPGSRRDVAARALAAMAGSPLRDEDGGFFRYATRRDWSVPHYERMLSDNAQLLALSEERIARGIVDFLMGTLHRDGGGFAAAQDSESWIDGARNEGGYYRRPVAARAELPSPAIDEKVITGWNGLAIGSLAQTGFRFDEPEWVTTAAETAAFVLERHRGPDGRWRRATVGGAAMSAHATRADLGLLSEGLFMLAAATGEVAWAVAARRVLDDVLSSDDVADGLLLAQGIAVAPDDSDGDLPSGASAVAAAALAAWRLGAGEGYRDAAVRIVEGVLERALAEPLAHGALLRVAAGLVQPPRQIVAVGAPLGLSSLRHADADVVSSVSAAQAVAFAEAGFSLFEGKAERPDHVFDCRAFVCRLPVPDAGLVPLAR